jgi:DNA-binding MarR family transcriptional regulator
MMRIGSIQRDILMLLYRCGDTGAFIGSTTKARELRGYDLAQVERALTSLIGRGLVRKEGIRYIICPTARNWCWYEKNHAPAVGS